MKLAALDCIAESNKQMNYFINMDSASFEVRKVNEINIY